MKVMLDAHRSVDTFQLIVNITDDVTTKFRTGDKIRLIYIII